MLNCFLWDKSIILVNNIIYNIILLTKNKSINFIYASISNFRFSTYYKPMSETLIILLYLYKTRYVRFFISFVIILIQVIIVLKFIKNYVL